MLSRMVFSFLGLAMLCLPLRAEDFTVAVVPEPSSIILFATAFGGLIVLHRKSRKKDKD